MNETAIEKETLIVPLDKANHMQSRQGGIGLKWVHEHLCQ